MNPRKRSPFTSGKGSIVIEIKCKAVPIGPDIPQPPRIRPPRRKPEQGRGPLPPFRPSTPPDDESPKAPE